MQPLIMPSESFDHMLSFNLKRSTFYFYSNKSLSQIFRYEIRGDSFHFNYRQIIQIRRRLNKKKIVFIVTRASSYTSLY